MPVFIAWVAYAGLPLYITQRQSAHLFTTHRNRPCSDIHHKYLPSHHSLVNSPPRLPVLLPPPPSIHARVLTNNASNTQKHRCDSPKGPQPVERAQLSHRKCRQLAPEHNRALDACCGDPRSLAGTPGQASGDSVRGVKRESHAMRANLSPWFIELMCDRLLCSRQRDLRSRPGVPRTPQNGEECVNRTHLSLDAGVASLHSSTLFFPSMWHVEPSRPRPR